MAQPYVGEIRLFAGNFAPVDWALCDGSSLSISQHDILYTLIGTTYGGDGVQTFNLPDLRSRVPMHQGPTNPIGQSAGSETVTLSTQQMPAHSHVLNATTNNSQLSPTNNLPGQVSSSQANAYIYGQATTLPTTLSPASIANTVGGHPHPNIQPSLALNFIIALSGIYPTQS